MMLHWATFTPERSGWSIKLRFEDMSLHVDELGQELVDMGREEIVRRAVDLAVTDHVMSS